MALAPQKFREIVFQLLYSRNFEKSDWESAVSLVMRENAVPKSTVRQAQEKVEAICHVLDKIDELISSISLEYAFDRITRIEQTLLRLGMYELLHTDVPPKVVIAEAVRLARKFSTAEGASFVNALLDAVYKTSTEQEHETLSTESIPV